MTVSCWWYVVSSQYLRESILIPTCYTLCTTFPVLHLTYYLHNNNTCPLIFLLITYYVRPAIYFYLLSADCLLPMACCPGPHEFACQISVPDFRARFVPGTQLLKGPKIRNTTFWGCQICAPDLRARPNVEHKCCASRTHKFCESAKLELGHDNSL